MTVVPFMRAEALPALTRPVTLSASLAYHAGPRHIGDHYSPPIEGPSAADIDEARRTLVEAEHLCRPPSARVIALWMTRFKALPWGPNEEADVRAAMSDIASACGALPIAAFTAETANVALQRWRRWPTAADVHDVLSAHAAPFLRQRDQLRRIAALKPAPPAPAREGPDNAAMQHVASIVQAFVSERRQAVTSAAPAKPKPRPLSPAELVATWEKALADKVPGAAIRLAMARKALEAESHGNA